MPILSEEHLRRFGIVLSHLCWHTFEKLVHGYHTPPGPRAAPLELGSARLCVYDSLDTLEMCPNLGVNAIVADHEIRIVGGAIFKVQSDVLLSIVWQFFDRDESFAKM